MKILQVIHSLRRAGAERVVAELAIGLSQKGHDVTICTLYNVCGYSYVFQEQPQIKWAPLLDRPGGRFLADLPRLVVHLEKEIKLFRPDIIHCHLPTDTAVCCLTHGAPCVSTIHTNIPFPCLCNLPVTSWPVMLLDYLMLRHKSQQIVACSEAAYAAMIRLGWPPERTRCILNGIDTTRFRQRKSQQRLCSRIAMVGTLETRKNYPMALEAFCRLQKLMPDVELRICGAGTEQAYLATKARDLGVADRVVFAGNVIDIAQELSQADIYWMTSRREGLPMAAIEAMASAVPVIATDIPGLHDLLARWPGCLAPLDDAEQLAIVTMDLLANPERAWQIGAEMREEVITRYSSDRMTDQYLSLYAEIYNGNYRTAKRRLT